MVDPPLPGRKNFCPYLDLTVPPQDQFLPKNFVFTSKIPLFSFLYHISPLTPYDPTLTHTRRSPPDDRSTDPISRCVSSSVVVVVCGSTRHLFDLRVRPRRPTPPTHFNFSFLVVRPPLLTTHRSLARSSVWRTTTTKIFPLGRAARPTMSARAQMLCRIIFSVWGSFRARSDSLFFDDGRARSTFARLVRKLLWYAAVERVVRCVDRIGFFCWC